ncbi:conserved hypothetical protein [Cupriavidus taiwanensis]|nr:conserved hypothetical protein [Cupriavidus taiwanensis]
MLASNCAVRVMSWWTYGRRRTRVATAVAAAAAAACLRWNRRSSQLVSRTPLARSAVIECLVIRCRRSLRSPPVEPGPDHPAHLFTVKDCCYDPDEVLHDHLFATAFADALALLASPDASRPAAQRRHTND